MQLELSAVFLQKLFSYCVKLKEKILTRPANEVCQECLRCLFCMYFGKAREDCAQALAQLQRELEGLSGTNSLHDKLFANMTISILVRTEGLNKKDFLERSV